MVRRLVRFALSLGVALAVGLTLATAAALLAFTHPMSDDLCNAANALEVGILETVRREYLGWGGRWASHLWVMAFPTLFDVRRAYPLGLAVCAVLSVVSLQALIGALLPLCGRRALLWSLTLGLVALHWAGMPDPGQTAYWFEGAAVYSVNVSLALCVVAGLLRLPRMPGPRRGATTALLSILALFTAAFHELFGLMLAAVLAVGAAVCLRWRDGRGWAWVSVMAAALAGFCSVLRAPGNEVRGPTLNPEGPDPVRALLATVQMWVRVLDVPLRHGDPMGGVAPLGWLVDARLLGATILFSSAPAIRSLRPPWLERDPRLWRWLVPLVWLGALTGSFAVGGWALGRTLPLRAFDALYLIFLLGWFLTLLVYMRPSDGASTPAFPEVLRVFAALIFATGLVFSTNHKLALRDLLRGRAVAFDREMTRRYADADRLRRSGGGTLAVNAIEPWPESYLRGDVGDVSPALRACVVRFLGVDEVEVREHSTDGHERL